MQNFGDTLGNSLLEGLIHEALLRPLAFPKNCASRDHRPVRRQARYSIVLNRGLRTLDFMVCE